MKTKEIATFRKTYKPYHKQCYFEGFKLAVHFDEKDDVKRYGGRWDADEKIWWMPFDNLSTDVHAGVGTVTDWLNAGKMIVGQYGKFNLNDHTENLFSSNNSKYTEYKLGTEGNGFWQVRFFFDEDVITYKHFSGRADGDNTLEYLTIEDGRQRWDALIEGGYNRVENS